MNALKDKTVIITGAASGMGKAIAYLVASKGAKVVVCDVNQMAIDELTNTMRSKGEQVASIASDVSKESDVERLIGYARTTFGSVDVLINNAGVMDDFMPVDKVSNDMLEHVMGVNFYGPFFTCRLVVPIMLEQGSGVIVNIASIGGLQGGRAGAAYTASKHALIGLTKNIGFMYAPKGIRCNAIAPGAVNTNIGKQMHPDPYGFERSMTGSQTMPRIGEADEIAKLALFLSGSDSAYLNGTVVTADGSWTAY
jgi:NAD(P)-dependent dehydrogenase (short-subunit alcohol dehydrogenase family)